MVTREKIDAAVRILAEAASPARIVLFGSHARGDAGEDSDIDLLVIEPEVEDRTREMVRLRRLLRPLRIPVDILVYMRRTIYSCSSCSLFFLPAPLYGRRITRFGL